ncbi:MAG: flagellar filament capping protein FliD [Ramlibacter sp.]
MPSITSTGVGSGLDVNSIVTSLMVLEKRPLTLLQGTASTLQTKLSAFGSLKSQIASLGDIATKLADSTHWNPLTADSTDAATVSASAASGAAPGKYRLEVQQLAQSQALASGYYAASTTTVGTGTITIELGTTSGGVFTPTPGGTPKNITIGAASQSLAGVRDAINAAGAGVTASIVNGAGGARLVLNGGDGAAGSMRVTVADDDANATDTAGLSALAWDPAAAVGAGRNLTQSQVAQDAQFTVNGLALTSATNTARDAVQGLTLTLSRQTTVPVDVTVAVQTVAVRKNVNDFVNAYNSLNKLLQQQTQADPGGTARGPLQADSTATQLLSSLRGMLQGSVTGLSGANSLSTAGLELQRDGSLKVNDTRLAPLLAEPAKLAQLFGQAQAGADTASRGFGVRFKEWAGALTSDAGTLASRTKGINESLTRNRKAQDAQEDRLTRTEARLRAQYQKLDTNMTSLNAQMAQLKSALGLV